MGRWRSRRRSTLVGGDCPPERGRGLIALASLIVLAWTLAPTARCGLSGQSLGRGARRATSGHPPCAVQFSASDGVKLSGWLAIASPDAPTIILVHGFKAARVSMLPWARFRYAANFTVLLYENCGCGARAGWRIGAGASEPDDIVGATRFLLGYHGLTNKRLGVSLGAGRR